MIIHSDCPLSDRGIKCYILLAKSSAESGYTIGSNEPSGSGIGDIALIPALNTDPANSNPNGLSSNPSWLAPYNNLGLPDYETPSAPGSTTLNTVGTTAQASTFGPPDLPSLANPFTIGLSNSAQSPNNPFEISTGTGPLVVAANSIPDAIAGPLFNPNLDTTPLS